ncbi:MAG: hypothetical protein HFI60_02300 [Lachnospiraceae bacterium]|jgi:hypothetical protein|nr:hypothetical protein [Lachnospiraceae bacterium]
MVCLVCGRTLKTQQSKDLGYGPVCYKKMFGNMSRKSAKRKSCQGSDDIPYYEIPRQMMLSDYLQIEK